MRWPPISNTRPRPLFYLGTGTVCYLSMQQPRNTTFLMTRSTGRIGWPTPRTWTFVLLGGLQVALMLLRYLDKLPVLVLTSLCILRTGLLREVSSSLLIISRTVLRFFISSLWGGFLFRRFSLWPPRCLTMTGRWRPENISSLKVRYCIVLYRTLSLINLLTWENNFFSHKRV